MIDPDIDPWSLSMTAPRHYQVIYFIRNELRCGADFPSLDEIKDFMGWDERRRVLDVMCALRNKEFMASEPPIGASVFADWSYVGDIGLPVPVLTKFSSSFSIGSVPCAWSQSELLGDS